MGSWFWTFMKIMNGIWAVSMAVMLLFIFWHLFKAIFSDFKDAVRRKLKAITKRINMTDMEQNLKYGKTIHNCFTAAGMSDKCDYYWFVKTVADAITAEQKKTKDGKLLIGICGNAGTGKDSATEFLKTVFPFQVEQMAFADPIRTIGALFGFTPKQMSDRKLKEEPDEFWQTSPRRFMQLVGTEMFRKQWREDAWTKLAELRIKRSNKDLIFITDVRFPNEADFIRSLGGKVVRITRNGFTKTGENLHDSEKFVNTIPVDMEIINDAYDATEWTIAFTSALFSSHIANNMPK